MKAGKTKRLSALILAAIVILCLAACGLPENKTPEQTQKPEQLIIKDRIILPDARSRIAGIAILGENVVAAAEKEGSAELTLYHAAVADSGKIRLEEAEKLLTLEGYTPIALSADGESAFLLTENNGAYSAHEINADGSKTNEITLKNLPDAPTGIAVCGDVRCVYGSAYIAAFGSDGSIERLMEFDALICSVTPAEESIIVSLFDFESEHGSYYYADVKTGALTEISMELPSEHPQLLMGNMAACQGQDDKYLICSGVELFLYDPGTGTCRRLLQWGGADDLNTRFSSVCQVGDNAFIMAERGGGLRTVSLVPRNNEITPTTVNVVIYGDEAEIMRNRVEAFAASSDEYEYSFCTFSSEEEDELQIYLNSGAEADLLLFSSPLNTSSQLFDDLYTYIDADGEIDRSDFLPHLLEALESGGELHELWTGVWLNLISARSDLVGDDRRLGIAECERISAAAELPVLPPYIDPASVAAVYGSAAFIDRRSGTCNFDSDEFAWLLTLCRNIPQTFDGDGLLVPRDYMAVEYMAETLFSGHERSIVGLPGTDGGNFYRPGSKGRGAAILRGGTNKAGAWAYIKNELGLGAQLGQSKNFPVIYEAAKYQAERFLSDENAERLFKILDRTTGAMRYVSDEPLIELIYSAAAAYAAGDKSLEETIEIIQTKANIYIAEQS